MNSLQTRLQSLLVAGRKNSEQFNQLMGIELLPSGWSVAPGIDFSDELNTRLVIAPSRFFTRPSVAFVSSRLPKNLSTIPAWFDFLRAGFHEAKRDRHLVLNIETVTCHRFVQRAGTSMNLDVLPIQVLERNLDWFLKLKNWSRIQTVMVTPSLGQCERSECSDANDILLALAQQIRVTKLNSNSGTGTRVKNLLQQQNLTAANPKHKSVFIAKNSELVPDKEFDSLHKEGAKAWHVSTVNRTCPQPTSVQSLNRLKIQSAKEFAANGSEFLFHCTRAPNGPWPEQSENQYLDRLLNGWADAQTPLDSLRRIIGQQRIRAKCMLNRTDQPVVSFTDCALEQIKAMRVFRPHLARWDFEPFGIGIRRQTLCEIFGARPAIYGASEVYRQLVHDQRPFFQLKQTTTSTGKIIDWTNEREWRVLGDVDLTRIPKNDCLVFVSTVKDALKLSDTCRYNIVVMNEEPAKGV